MMKGKEQNNSKKSPTILYLSTRKKHGVFSVEEVPLQSQHLPKVHPVISRKFPQSTKASYANLYFHSIAGSPVPELDPRSHLKVKVRSLFGSDTAHSSVLAKDLNSFEKICGFVPQVPPTINIDLSSISTNASPPKLPSRNLNGLKLAPLTHAQNKRALNNSNPNAHVVEATTLTHGKMNQLANLELASRYNPRAASETNEGDVTARFNNETWIPEKSRIKSNITMRNAAKSSKRKATIKQRLAGIRKTQKAEPLKVDCNLTFGSKEIAETLPIT